MKRPNDDFDLNGNNPIFEEHEIFPFPLEEFELDIIKFDYIILSEGRKIYRKECITFEKNVEINDSNCFTYYGFISVDLTDYNIEIRIRDTPEYRNVIKCFCDCKQENPENENSICVHTVAGLFQLRFILMNYPFFSYSFHEEYSQEKVVSSGSSQINLGKISSKDKNIFLKEFICQICLELLSKPVLMGCHSHSICEKCVRSFLLVSKNWRNLYYEVACPTCGEKAGTLQIHLNSELKINRELARIMEIYVENLGFLKEEMKERPKKKMMDENLFEPTCSCDQKIKEKIPSAKQDLLDNETSIQKVLLTKKKKKK